MTEYDDKLTTLFCWFFLLLKSGSKGCGFLIEIWDVRNPAYYVSRALPPNNRKSSSRDRNLNVFVNGWKPFNADSVNVFCIIWIQEHKTWAFLYKNLFFWMNRQYLMKERDFFLSPQGKKIISGSFPLVKALSQNPTLFLELSKNGKEP